MGKASLLWVLMVSLSLSVLVVEIKVRNNQAGDVGAKRFDETMAKSIATSAAEIAILMASRSTGLNRESS